MAELNDDNVVVLTLDHRQAVAAEALGLTLYDRPTKQLSQVSPKDSPTSDSPDRDGVYPKDGY